MEKNINACMSVYMNLLYCKNREEILFNIILKIIIDTLIYYSRVKMLFLTSFFKYLAFFKKSCKYENIIKI